MKRLLLHWLVLAAAVALTSHYVAGVHVGSLRALAVAAAALGLVNAVVRPVLSLLAFPLTLLTLGLFYLVVNGASFALAAYLVDGFAVTGFVPAVIGALVTSVASTMLGWLLGIDDEKKKKKKKRD